MKSRIPAIIFSALTLFAIGLAASGFNPREFARKHGGTMRLSVATGNTGGVYYPYGGGLARVISQSVPHVDATAEVTDASVDNLKLIQLGKADIAFVLTDTLDDAIRGRGPFAKSAGQGAHACGALSELHAGRHDRGKNIESARRSERARRLDRLTGQRHRSDRVPRC